MKIKKGDTVVVKTGKDKGKKGKVESAFPKDGMVVVSGVNVKKRHQKPKSSKQKGQILEQAAPIDSSNVMLVDPSKNVPTRVKRIQKDGKSIRVAAKSGTELS